MKILTSVATYLESHTTARNAAWVFYWIKCFLPNQRTFTLEKVLAKAPPFNRRQAKKYLQILVELKWVCVDFNGVYYLRGRDFLIKKYAFGKCRAAQPIPPEAFSTQTSWRNFISSKATTDAAIDVMSWGCNRNIDYTARARSVSAGLTTGKAVSVAISAIAKHTGRSKASAQRTRKRASAFLRIDRIWIQNPNWIHNGGQSNQELLDGASWVFIDQYKRIRGSRPCKSLAKNK